MLDSTIYLTFLCLSLIFSFLLIVCVYIYIYIIYIYIYIYIQEPGFALAFARIENHYFTSKGFFPHERWHLENIYKIRHIPTFIVQGRYDVVCPMKTAWDLHRAFPEAEFVVVEDSGHSTMEPGTRSELVKATDRFGLLHDHEKLSK